MGAVSACSYCERVDDDSANMEVEDRLSEIRKKLSEKEKSVGESQKASSSDAGEASPLPIVKQRRRLSVQSGESGMAGAGGWAENRPISHVSSNHSDLKIAGLSDIFDSDALKGRRAVAVGSVTALTGGRRASFMEKSEEVLFPPGYDDEKAMISWVRSIGLGWACKKGLKPESPNQDSFSILAVEKEFILIGVYDGHGPDGHDVSQFARQEVVRHFVTNPKRNEDPETALVNAFLSTQKKIEKDASLNAWESGTTCTMLYVDMVKKCMTVAHVGDARCALGKRNSNTEEYKTADLTIDHKPNLAKERQRIENADPPGRVIFDGYVNHRVFVKNGMYPGLNMSRALGDVLAHKQAGLTAMPDTKTIDLKSMLKDFSDIVVVVCTDGVWEFLESHNAFKVLAADEQDPEAQVNRLALRSWDLWLKDSNGEVCDDITAVCLHLHNAFTPQSQTES